MTRLSRSIALLAVGSVALWWFSHALGLGQASLSEQSGIVVIGKVQSICGNAISVQSGAQLTHVLTDANTKVWKGGMFHDLSPVQAGDDLSARCRRDASGKLMAEAIWLVVNFFGVITHVDGDSFEMLTNPNADPKSAYQKKKLKVTVDAATVFNDSTKGDLRAGRTVQMVGLDLKGGTVRATRLTVYEGNRPVRMAK